MRKLIPILSMLFMFTYSLLGQTTTVSLPDTTAIKGSEVLVPVQLGSSLSDVGAVTFRISYNSDAVDFVSIENNNLIGGSFLTNTVGDSLLLVSWTNLSDPVDLEKSIFDIKFAYKSGTSELKFVGENEVADVNGDKYAVTFVNGQIAPLPVQVSLSNEVGAVGDTVVVEVSGAQLEDIGSMNLYIDYSEASATFLGIGEVNLPGFIAGTSTNKVNLGMANSQGFDHASGVMATLLFEVVAGTTDLSLDVANSIVQQTDFTVVPIVYSDGQVSLIDGTLAFGDVMTKVNDTVSVPLYAYDAVNVGSFNVDVTYDKDVLTFISAEGLDGLITNDKGGTISFGYANGSGLTANGEIAQLLFTSTVASNSAISFEKSSANITDVNFNALNFAFDDGSVIFKENSAPVFTAVIGSDVSTVDNWESVDTYTFQYEATDADGDELTFSLEDDLQGQASITVDGMFTFTAVMDDNIYPSPDPQEIDFDVLVSVTDGALSVSDTSVLKANITTDLVDNAPMPTEYALEQNYPNPFNPTSTIQFALPKQSNVNIAVYNMLGQKVATLTNSQLAAGVHTVQFNAVNLSSGIYFYNIKASAIDGSKEFTSVKKMMLMK